MWMDIAICAIMAGSIAWGYHRGFMVTFLHTAGWVLSIVLSFVWRPAMASLIKEKTSIYDRLYASLSDKLVVEEGVAVTAGESFNDFPSILQEALNAALGSLTESLTESLADLLLNIICFLLVIVVIKTLFWLLVALFSKERNDGITGFMDGMFGALFGALKGGIFIFFVLAVLVPFLGLTQNQFVAQSLESSMVAGILYDGNAVFLLFRNYL